MGEAQPVGQLAHVLSDAHGMAVGGRVPLVDDVGERLERHCHLVPQPHQAAVDLVEQKEDGSEGRGEPEVLQGGEREQHAEPHFGGGREDVGLGQEPSAHERHAQASDRAVDHAEDGDRQEILRDVDLSRGRAGELEGEAAGQGCGPQACSAPEGPAPGLALEGADRERADHADQGRRPGAEHDDRRDVNRCGEGEPLAFELRQELIVRALKELGEEESSGKQGERAQGRHGL